MHVLRDCKMISLDTYRSRRVLLGFLLLVSCESPVWTAGITHTNLSASNVLNVGDRLLSTPNPFFELGIFQYNYSSTTGGIVNTRYLSIRYAPPIDQAVTWVASRDIPLTDNAVLQFENGNLELYDQRNIHQPGNIWDTGTANSDVVSAQLLDSGNLVLKNKNGTVVWNSFDNISPTDTLLPGQGMNRSQGYSLNSWQRTGNPAILNTDADANANDTYAFGWDAKGVLTLSWTCPKVSLDWKGGPFIPAPDVYAAHTIRNVDKVYFHVQLGHLYIDSHLYTSPTAVLSGGPDPVNVTTLKRITMFPDGGLRIMQYTINQTLNQTSNQRWKVVANWVVLDRPDSRSQCTTFGTCGQFSECITPINSLELVTCQCPGKGNSTTENWFMPINNETTKGCTPPTQRVDCPNGTYSGTINPAGMLVLPNTDMPWGGDYRNLTGNDSANCMQACINDCHCAGAVYSKEEQMCWLKTGSLYNLGYPTEALHGTDRTSFLRNQTVLELPKSPAAKKDNKLVKILLPAVGIPGVLLFVVGIFCLWRNEMVRQRVRACGSIFRRRRPRGPDVMVFQGGDN